MKIRNKNETSLSEKHKAKLGALNEHSVKAEVKTAN